MWGGLRSVRDAQHGQLTQLPAEYAGHPQFDTTPIQADYKSVKEFGDLPQGRVSGLV